jgi:DNA-binding NarL/FixJ family response regulator
MALTDRGRRTGLEAPEVNGEMRNDQLGAHARPELLIIAERRELVAGSFVCWLNTFCPDFEVMIVTDLERSLEPDTLRRAAAVILSPGAPIASDDWLERHIHWLRSKRAELPVALIVDDRESGAAEALSARFVLQGYIPTSSRMEVAAAAVRLLVAGGSYFPRIGPADQDPREVKPDHSRMPPDPAAPKKLTSRERAVLDLLSRGMPNKTIAIR